MSFLEGLRKKAASVILRYNIRKVNRRKQFMNLSDVRTVGVLFSPSENNGFGPVHEFIRQLSREGKQVYAIGYIDKNAVPDNFLLRQGYNFLCRHDLNWFFRPEADFVNDFIERELDLLVNLSFEDYLPLDYIHSLSRARFKTGRFRVDDNETTDLAIDVRNKRDTKYLIEQIIHYLQIINRKQQQ